MQKLPKAAAAVGFGLFRLLPGGTAPGDWARSFELQATSQRTLGADPGIRKKVLSALYPTFYKEIDLGLNSEIWAS